MVHPGTHGPITQLVTRLSDTTQVIIILIPVAYFGYVYWRRIQAQKKGLPPPPFNPFNHSDRDGASRIYPAPSGIVGWAKNKYHAIRGSGSRSGAYEPTASARRGLDPDEAWDARVGAESDGYGPGGYYEEQELGLRPPPAGYTGGGYGVDAPSYGEDLHRGRSISRDNTAYVGGGISRDRRNDEGLHPSERENPFGDTAETSSMRGVSPRPHEEGRQKQSNDEGGLKADSPTERRSMFREENL